MSQYAKTTTTSPNFIYFSVNKENYSHQCLFWFVLQFHWTLLRIITVIQFMRLKSNFVVNLRWWCWNQIAHSYHMMKKQLELFDLITVVCDLFLLCLFLLASSYPDGLMASLNDYKLDSKHFWLFPLWFHTLSVGPFGEFDVSISTFCSIGFEFGFQWIPYNTSSNVGKVHVSQSQFSPLRHLCWLAGILSNRTCLNNEKIM